MPAQHDSRRKAALPLLVIAVLAALVAASVWWVTRPGPLLIQGEVAAPRVDVSARTSGRVDEIMADLGSRVESGQVLAELSNPQLVTAHAAAASGAEVARASQAAAGATRPEVIRARDAELAAAQADLRLAEEQVTRDTELAQQGLRPQAAMDQTMRNVETAARRVEAAQAQLDLARAGASPEERAVAAAQVTQAEAALAQRQADLDELTIYAPLSGEISARLIELGENIGPGAPLFTIVDLDQAWFTFNLREDLLSGLQVGDVLSVHVPALQRDLDAQISLINVQGQFASWRATRATGDFDLRSFELRARPLAPVEGLRPGMSALISLGR
ncbi:HlyD family secretion protein [Roseinatronobacter alkalisoli]|uniref:Efflux RND transporter periplasmic adaptor subunit n=1 Tax=Roseinatronobacter alkalisoli TaxID=3028235 RepID=A0ABT5T669_9RHOB|nr:efflux RND transporter periplasmic adaptor subunit [Roseinatronobacter sp. HJB301]MDD7970613.1 efflux RND transporter periplasmic adaptor subunit [Roseinatronobacter sp. HJB301]